MRAALRENELSESFREDVAVADDDDAAPPECVHHLTPLLPPHEDPASSRRDFWRHLVPRRELERHRIHPRRLVRSIRRHRLVRLPRGAVREEPPPRGHRPAQTRPRDGNLGLSAVRRVPPRGPGARRRRVLRRRRSTSSTWAPTTRVPTLSAREAARATLHIASPSRRYAGRETSRRHRARASAPPRTTSSPSAPTDARSSGTFSRWRARRSGTRCEPRTPPRGR